MAQQDNLAARLNEALRLVDEAIADAATRLGQQPDNPAIQRVGGATGAFVIRLSDMTTTKNLLTKPGEEPKRVSRTSWSVFDHDWLAQYRYARKLLETRRFSALREMLANGSYRDPSHGLRFFAPEVIDNIKRITGYLRNAVSLTDARRMGDALDMPEPDRSNIDVAEPRQLQGRQLMGEPPRPARRRPRP